MTARPAVLVLALLALAGGAGAGCAPTDPPATAGGAPTGTVAVLAAASLTEVFTGLGKDFEAAHPGTKVVFSFGASSALAQQVNAGAPADVFASASPAPMRQVVDAAGVAGAPEVFVRNQLVIAVARGNPAGIGGLADLTRPGLKVARCASTAPCGTAADTVLAAAAVPLTPATLERDVKGALTKVRLGEVDAALVYRTDVAAVAGELTAVEFPESARAVNDYPIAALAQAPNPTAARAFVAFVRSPAALPALTAAGFQAP